MSSFAINGRIVFDPNEGPTAYVRAVLADGADALAETRRRPIGGGDGRLHLLELVAALALELRARGDHVALLDIE